MEVRVPAPKTGLTSVEVTVAAWLKQEGDSVRAGEPVAEVTTDKVNVEVTSPVDGVLSAILVPAGETVPVGADLAVVRIGTAPDAEAAAGAAVAAEVPLRIRATPGARRLARERGLDLALLATSSGGAPITKAKVTAYLEQAAAGVPRATPLARKLAAEHGVELRQVQGSGPGGRVMAADVLAGAAAAAAGDRLVPLTPMRRTIAERMSQSFHTAVPILLAVEVDVTRLVALREDLLPEVERTAGVRLTLTDLLLAAAGRALVHHPEVNASWTDRGILLHGQVNIGMAVAVPGGLVVPVLSEPHRLPLPELARRRAELTRLAREGRLRPEQLQGGTFTLSNLGQHGVDLFMPVLNPPQAAILGTGRVAPRAVETPAGVAFRPHMYLCLVLDHRVADGADGARFLSTLADLLGHPYRLLAT